ncbi:MAG: hypothetical protein CL946_00570 [Ectothiorhodospiraceae bacterium]|nr:hypothetical protein [Ectothiorhodospiraceae bacterium]
MSYSQIFRRINRIFASKVNDFIDRTEREELRDFDEMLRREQEKQQRQRAYESQRKSWDYSQAQKEQQSERSRQDEGKRRPGEKENAFYLQILGLHAEASTDDIKRAYKNLMAQYHPDRVANKGEAEKEAASKKAKEISEAYMILKRRKKFY